MSIEQFAKFITEQRKERGLTQNDLAKKLSVTDKAVSKWERGLNYPDISTIEALAKVFEVTVLELLNGEKKMGQDLKEKESIDKAVTETLDFSKQLIKNQKRNYLNQGLILIVVFLLVLVGYQGYNQMFGSLGGSIFDINRNLSYLQQQIDQMDTKYSKLNLYGNGIYYCNAPGFTFESIEFINSDVIRIYRPYGPVGNVSSTNSYFRMREVGLRQYTIIADVILDDSYGDFNMANAKQSWHTYGAYLFKLVEISEDHKTLYYGIDHSLNFCTLNVKPQ